MNIQWIWFTDHYYEMYSIVFILRMNFLWVSFENENQWILRATRIHRFTLFVDRTPKLCQNVDTKCISSLFNDAQIKHKSNARVWWNANDPGIKLLTSNKLCKITPDAFRSSNLRLLLLFSMHENYMVWNHQIKFLLINLIIN